MNEEQKYLIIMTTKRKFFISELAEIDQEGSLIRFFDNGNLLLAIPTEDFMWCELGYKPTPDPEVTR